MTAILVFDPPLCCSTGVCGPTVDPVLPRFAADLEWLRSRGVAVERYNLAQQPGAFAANSVVLAALKERGNDCLPLVLADGRIVVEGRYPERDELAQLAGLAPGGEPAETTVTGNGATGSGCCSTAPVVTIGGGPDPSPGSCC